MRIVTAQGKDLNWWRNQSENDREWLQAWYEYQDDREAERNKGLNEAIKTASEKKGFGVIVVLLYAIFQILGLKAK